MRRAEGFAQRAEGFAGRAVSCGEKKSQTGYGGLMEWHVAHNIADALAAAGADPKARFVGGGLSLTLLLQHGVEPAHKWIDLSGLPLDTIEGRPGELRIGAQVRLFRLAQEPLVTAYAPLLAVATKQTATPALRNQSTLGGELLQRTRCPLFRDVANLRCGRRLPGSGCAVLEGVQAPAAILQTSLACVAPSASELAVPLAALSAQATLLSVERPHERRVPLLDLYRPPGDSPHVENNLLPGELLTSITIPVSASAPAPASVRRAFGYARLADTPLRPLVQAAVALDFDLGPKDKTIVSARVVLGGVSTCPVRCEHTERALTQRPLTIETCTHAAKQALALEKPTAANWSLVECTEQALQQALVEATKTHATH